jgi:hypothetical protein
MTKGIINTLPEKVLDFLGSKRYLNELIKVNKIINKSLSHKNLN